MGDILTRFFVQGTVLFPSVRDFYDLIYEFFQIVDVEGECYFGFFGEGVINGRRFFDVYFHVFPSLLILNRGRVYRFSYDEY
jgi:hypothetical protein